MNVEMPPSWLPGNISVYVAVLTVHLGIFLNGTFIGWTSPVLYKLSSMKDNPLGRIITDTEQGWLVSIGVFGNWTGSFLSGTVAKNYGRKKALMIFALPMLVSYAMFSFAKTFWLMLIARILGGVTSGAMFTVDPMYFGEVAEPKNRSLLGSGMNAFLNIGILFILCAGPYNNFLTLHIILTTCPFIYIFMLFFFVPETPYYLIEDSEEQAEAVLKKLRGKEDVKSELDQMKEYAKNRAENKGHLSELYNDRITRRALIIGCGLLIFQQSSGIGIITSFGQIIFKDMNDFLPSDLSAIILGIAQVIFSFIAPAITDGFGRKKGLIFSHIGMSLSLLVFGSYFLMKEHGDSVHSIDWLPLTALILFKFTYSAGSGPLPFVVIGEIFPQKIKGPASSITSVASSITALIQANTYTFLKETIGIGFTFWIFASVGAIASIFILYNVLETKGKTLQEIQEALRGSDCSEKSNVPVIIS